MTARLFDSLRRLAELTRREQRLAVIALHGELVSADLESQSHADYDLRDLRRRYHKLRALTRPTVRIATYQSESGLGNRASRGER